MLTGAGMAPVAFSWVCCVSRGQMGEENGGAGEDVLWVA